MHSLLQPRRAILVGLAAMVLALQLASTTPATSFAQALPGTNSRDCGAPVGPSDYPVSGGPTHGGGWFYTQEASQWPPICGVGPTRARGYTVLDDDKGNFWTEFRRFGGVEVLGYPVSQPYHLPLDGLTGYWYQAFQRGILQYHPEMGRAEMANVFEQFTQAGLDRRLEYFGIPAPQSVPPLPPVAAANNAGTVDFGRFETEQRMSWLTEPMLLARYFFDPVAFHSSEPDRPGGTAFATQEQAWAFFGLPQGGAERMVLRAPNDPSKDLWPLRHAFVAQRFQKSGLELFLEDTPPTTERFDPARTLAEANYSGVIFDPTVVPGDGKRGCVAVTAVGLLARTIGIDKVIPRAQIQPLPLDENWPYFTTYVPPTISNQLSVQFQIAGTGFRSDEPITVRLTDGQTNRTNPPSVLPVVTSHVDRANSDGSFDLVLTARIGTYTLTAMGDTSGSTFKTTVDLAVPTAGLNKLESNGGATCRPVGLPVGG